MRQDLQKMPISLSKEKKITKIGALKKFVKKFSLTELVDCKKRARLNAMRYVLHKLNYTGKDIEAIGPAGSTPWMR